MKLNGKIKLKNKEFKYVIEYKKINKLYFRFVEETIYVSSPLNVEEEKIVALLLLNCDALLQLYEKSSVKPLLRIENYGIVNILEKEYTLIYAKFNRIVDDKIFIKGEDYEKNFYKICSEKFKKYFEDRIKYFYQYLYIENEVPTLRLRLMKTRYGVYNAKTNMITLNLALLFYKKDLIDYVIVHELSHMKVMSHSKDFYKEVQKILPNYKELEKRMKSEGVRL